MSVDCDEHTLYLDQGKKDFTVRINVSSGWFTSTKGKPGEEKKRGEKGEWNL